MGEEYTPSPHPARFRAPTSPSRGGLCASVRSSGGGEGLLEKGAAELETGLVDAVPDALRHVPFNRKPGLSELLPGDQHGVDRDHLVSVAMHEEDRWARARALGKSLGIASAPE